MSKVWFTFTKLSKKKGILNNHNFGKWWLHLFTYTWLSINSVYTFSKKLQCLLFCQKISKSYARAPLFLTWHGWHFPQNYILSVFNVRLKGRKFSSSKETIFWRKLASTRKNFQGTNIDWQENQCLHFFFDTLLKVMTFINFCFTCSFRW